MLQRELFTFTKQAIHARKNAYLGYARITMARVIP